MTDPATAERFRNVEHWIALHEAGHYVYGSRVKDLMPEFASVTIEPDDDRDLAGHVLGHPDPWRTEERVLEVSRTDIGNWSAKTRGWFEHSVMVFLGGFCVQSAYGVLSVQDLV